jgi:hypothetical protein
MLKEFLVYSLIVLVKQLSASFLAPNLVMDAKLLLFAMQCNPPSALHCGGDSE